jgi:DNA mismatch repair protein MutS2
MMFDTDTLEPLYKFSLGQPGSSFTFEVAQINGIPMELIEDAKSRMDDRKVRMDKLLNELQREKTYLERLNKEHIEAQELAQKAKNEFLEKKSKLEEKLKSVQEQNEINNKFISSGKKMNSYIQRFITRSKKRDINKPLIDEMTKYITVEKSKIEEADRIEKLKIESKLPKKVTKKQKVQIERDEYERAKIILGSTVKLIATKQSGTVEEINGEMITVVFGFMRMKVEREKLMWVK